MRDNNENEWYTEYDTMQWNEDAEWFYGDETIEDDQCQDH